MFGVVKASGLEVAGSGNIGTAGASWSVLSHCGQTGALPGVKAYSGMWMLRECAEFAIMAAAPCCESAVRCREA